MTNENLCKSEEVLVTGYLSDANLAQAIIEDTGVEVGKVHRFNINCIDVKLGIFSNIFLVNWQQGFFSKALFGIRFNSFRSK